MNKLVLFLIRAVQTLIPAALEKVREEVGKGSVLQRIRERVEEAMNDSESKQEEEPAIEEPVSPSKKKAANLTREEWLDLTKRYTTQVEAQRATGYDPKTIAKYLEAHRIPNPWAQKSLPG
jgi:microcompartment protein CcmL/EutN